VNVGDGGLIVFGGEHRGGFAPFYLWRGSAVLAKLKSSTVAAPAQTPNANGRDLMNRLTKLTVTTAALLWLVTGLPPLEAVAQEKQRVSFNRKYKIRLALHD